MDGLCRRCRKPGHLARDCRDAWAVPRPDAPAVDASANAGPGNPDAPAADASADAGPGDLHASSAFPPDEDDMDGDYVPLPDGDEFSASESEMLSGDEEVIAATPPPLSPRRRQRKRKHRAGSPAQKVPRESVDMDTSSDEAPNHRLFCTYREVWDDKLSWEGNRARKSRADPPVSQEPSSTPELFSDPSSGSGCTPVPPATPEPSPFSSDGSVVDSVVLEEDSPEDPPDFFELLTEFCFVVPAADGMSERYDYGLLTDKVIFEQVSLAQLRWSYYVEFPEYRPPSAGPPGPVEVLPDIPPAEFPGPPPPRE